MKKVLVLTLFVLFSVLPVKAAFSDVPTDNIYKSAIDYVQEQGIVSGYSDGTFKPENPITRGEFTKIVIGAIYEDSTISNCMNNNYINISGDGGSTYKDLFNDVEGGYSFLVSEGNYKYFGGVFTQYICIAKLNNIISGYSDGTYKPDASITVGEASKIIANAFKVFDKQYGEPSEADWFSPYLKSINAVIELPYSLKDREQKLTRGEMADLVAKLKYYKEGKNFVASIPNSQVRKVKIYFHDSKIDPEVTDCAANNYYEAIVPFDNTPVRRIVEYVLNTYNLTGQHGYGIESLNLVNGQADIKINRTGYGFGTCGGATVSTSIEKSVESFEGIKNAIVTGNDETFI